MLPGDQQRKRVARDLCVADQAVRLLRRDHALNEVLRMLAQLRSPTELLARGRGEPADRGVQLAHRAVECAVRRQSHVAPVRERSDGPAGEHREHPLDMARQRIVGAFQRVDVLTERERGGYVDGERHQQALDVDHLAGARAAREAAVQPLG